MLNECTQNILTARAFYKYTMTNNNNYIMHALEGIVYAYMCITKPEKVNSTGNVL